MREIDKDLKIFSYYKQDKRVKRKPRDCLITALSTPSRYFNWGTIFIDKCENNYTIVLTEDKIGQLAMTFYGLYSLRF